MRIRKVCLTNVVLCVLLLAGCQCSHEWVEAGCTTPKTCSQCGETEGEPIGHTWVEASCTAPKTCSVCGETEGEPIGHTWVEASCAAPKSCSVCGETEGEPVGHTWVEASCAAPKSCSVCGETEGEALPHTWVEANYQDPKTCSVCGAVEGEPLTASFRLYGLETNLYENVHSDTILTPFSLAVTCGDGIHKTTADLFICDYRTFTSDETHLPVSGYEWRTFDYVLFIPKNADVRYVGLAVLDYYTWDNGDNAYFDVSISGWGYLSGPAQGYYANYHGEKYPWVYSIENQYTDIVRLKDSNEEQVFVTGSVYCCVPVGFDGVVVAFFDSEKFSGGTFHLYNVDKTTQFFRMENNPKKMW
ncbi:MAG: hypothetical protein ACI4P4_16350 [Faecousia sp.]